MEKQTDVMRNKTEELEEMTKAVTEDMELSIAMMENVRGLGNK